jgi:hypothetical protein
MEESGLQPKSTIVITAHRLDAARTQIDAERGATVYSLTNETIRTGLAGRPEAFPTFSAKSLA